MAEKYFVEGYEFDTVEEANQAKKELEAVKFMSAKTEKCPPQETLLLYKKIVNENMFKTPVGRGYLKILEEYLAANGMFDMKDGEKVARTAVSNNKIIIKDSSAEAKKDNFGKADKVTSNKKLSGKTTDAKIHNKNAGGKKRLVEEILEKPEPKKEPQISVEVVEAQLKKTKDKLTTSIIINFLLAAGIVAMIYIASTSSNINILNYETALLDKYSSWAQELQDKENELNERERALNSQ